MKLKSIYIGSLCFAALLGSCKKIEEGCDVVKPTSALVNEVSDSMVVGIAYKIPVDYVLENSCGKFLEFKTDTSANHMEVKLITKYEGCNCDLSFKEEVVDYELQFDNIGTYSIDFWVDEDDYNSFLIEVYQ